MTRKEFLESLERHLRGQLSENQLRGHVEYYRDYIEKEIASGKTEAEVLDMLGDPWLIAKTLIDSGAWSSQETGEYVVQEEDGEFVRESKKTFRKLDLTTWYGKLIVILAAALILFVLIRIIGALLPILFCLAVVGVIVKAFQKRR